MLSRDVDAALADRRLVDGLRAGDHAAFARVYEQYHAAIYNLCARILGDREEAKDVTHDVFITAFRRPPGDERAGGARLRPWLYRVATNACLNRLRERKRLAADAAAVETARAPVDEYERAQITALVEQSLAALNDRYRTALVLKDLHGLPAAEIAEVMAVSRPTADVLVHRARSAFKAAFVSLGGRAEGAPSTLGLALAPLPVPAALQVVPPLPASPGALPDPTALASPAAPAVQPPPAPDPSTVLAPHGAGLPFQDGPGQVLAAGGAVLPQKV